MGLIRPAILVIDLCDYWTRFTLLIEAQELERCLPERRRFGKKGDRMLAGERHGHDVSGHCAEVIDEAGEAIDAVAIGVALGLLLGPCYG